MFRGLEFSSVAGIVLVQYNSSIGKKTNMFLMVLNGTISYINHVFDLCGLSFQYHSKAIVA